MPSKRRVGVRFLPGAPGKPLLNRAVGAPARGDEPPGPPRFDSQLTTARRRWRFPEQIGVKVGGARFCLTGSILFGHFKSAADLERPL